MLCPCHDQDPFVERHFRKVALSNFLVSSSPPFAARDFLDCPNHLPKVGKVKVSDFSAVLDLKILQPNFKTRLTYIKNDKLETRSKFGQQQLELTSWNKLIIFKTSLLIEVNSESFVLEVDLCILPRFDEMKLFLLRLISSKLGERYQSYLALALLIIC